MCCEHSIRRRRSAHGPSGCGHKHKESEWRNRIVGAAAHGVYGLTVSPARKGTRRSVEARGPRRRRVRGGLRERGGGWGIARLVPRAACVRIPGGIRQRDEHGGALARLRRRRDRVPRRAAGAALSLLVARGVVRRGRRRGSGDPVAHPRVGVSRRGAVSRARGLPAARVPATAAAPRPPPPRCAQGRSFRGRARGFVRGGCVRRVLRRRARDDPARAARLVHRRRAAAAQWIEGAALRADQLCCAGRVRVLRPGRVVARRADGLDESCGRTSRRSVRTPAPTRRVCAS